METKNYPEEIDVQKYLLVLKRRWLIASGVFAVFATLGGINFVMQPPVYEGSGKLLFQSNQTSSLTGVGEKIGHLESIKREANPLDTQAIVMQSEPVILDVIKTLNLKDKKGNPLSPDAISIKTEAVVGTDVLKVSYTSDNPESAKAIVDQVMKSYIANNILSNRTQAISAGGFIEKELPRAKAQLEKAAEALREFKLKNQILELAEETRASVKNISDVENELAKARSELADASAQEIQIRRQMNLPVDQAVDITSLSQIPAVQGLLAELQKVETQLAALKARYTETHPAVVDLESQEANINSLLQQQISQSLGYKAAIAPGKLQMGEIKQNLTSDFVRLQSQRLGLEKKVEALSAIIASYKRRADVMPNLEKQQGDLERGLSIAQKSYENLLTRQQEIQVAENQTVGNAKVVEYAKVAPSPAVKRKRFVITLGSGFVGLLLGVASAFFVDLIDRRLKTTKEAEALFGYTLLGLIPKFENNNTSTPLDSSLEKVSQRIIVATSPRTVIHEAYQMLQANLKFISLDRKISTIVVTSSVSGEGKTEVAANLAAVMSLAGRRVLLVDADMRQPSQHHLWGLINSVGLSNFMVGENKFTNSVRKIANNLSVLTAGVMPPNPLALIDSERMTSFIDILSKTYDCVIFDTPPLIGSADAAVLGNMVDGVLIVVRPGVVDSNTATAAKSLLARSEANILGIVANAVNVKHEPDNYFYYNNSRTENGVEKVDTASIP
ncbi:polysaccharide biosynthesis tyrosine autokinase [Hassallia byssoidea VB512170]|uniref:non-specific protein-tyrosine kinase n=1 Tax=Hassallia byssoidea VB512170 TaxID=1304833 RepID=A0A846HDH5_9CYAN|nr:polysaccharide biosynthesis tyrosine autokinase [Hassalia byssoidea]NEU75018.1 polysaccharide biosynthesis tyrosine autokinase [Hassalia byssoidea VB512170]